MAEAREVVQYFGMVRREMVGHARDLVDLAAVEDEEGRQPKRYWVAPYLQRRLLHGEYDALLTELMIENPEKFKELMRMDVATFHEILHLVAPNLTLQSTNCRDLITPGQKLAFTIRYLSTGISYRDLAATFRVSPSSVSRMVVPVCQAILDALERDYLKIPIEPEDWKDVARRFQHRWQFPHTMGAIDGKHIAIQKPPPVWKPVLQLQGLLFDSPDGHCRRRVQVPLDPGGGCWLRIWWPNMEQLRGSSGSAGWCARHPGSRSTARGWRWHPVLLCGRWRIWHADVADEAIQQTRHGPWREGLQLPSVQSSPHRGECLWHSSQQVPLPADHHRHQRRQSACAGEDMCGAAQLPQDQEPCVWCWRGGPRGWTPQPHHRCMEERRMPPWPQPAPGWKPRHQGSQEAASVPEALRQLTQGLRSMAGTPPAVRARPERGEKCPFKDHPDLSTPGGKGPLLGPPPLSTLNILPEESNDSWC